jgi:hypothetical protein
MTRLRTQVRVLHAINPWRSPGDAHKSSPPVSTDTYQHGGSGVGWAFAAAVRGIQRATGRLPERLPDGSSFPAAAYLEEATACGRVVVLPIGAADGLYGPAEPPEGIAVSSVYPAGVAVLHPAAPAIAAAEAAEAAAAAEEPVVDEAAMVEAAYSAMTDGGAGSGDIPAAEGEGDAAGRDPNTKMEWEVLADERYRRLEQYVLCGVKVVEIILRVSLVLRVVRGTSHAVPAPFLPALNS